MNILKSILCMGGAVALSAGIIGCTESGTEPIYNPNGNATESSSSHNAIGNSSSSSEENIIGLELEFNYYLLDYYYLYAHGQYNEVDDFYSYYNPTKLKTNSKSVCSIYGDTDEYERVCSMYAHMSDNFTRYFYPKYAAIIERSLTESEASVGIGAMVEEVSTADSSTILVVSEVYENGPSEKAGLKAGDTILSVNGTSPADLEAFDLLVGDKVGKVVDVKVRRDTVTTLAISIGEYNAPTVHLAIKDSIPVIQITEFTSTTSNEDGTYGEFKQVLKKIKDDYKAVVIDLRGNPGGDVDQCNKVSAELLAAGDTIIIDVETDVDSTGYGSKKEYFQKLDTIPYVAEVDGIGKDLYYVFLANDSSASCAELMLSAVTINKKSPVVGLTTYGKGIGQYVMWTYVDGLALVTAMRSMDKNGDIYHKVGIAPDYKLKDRKEQMDKALEIAKNAAAGKKETRTAGYGTEPTGNFAKRRIQGSTKLPTNKKEVYDLLDGAFKFKK